MKSIVMAEKPSVGRELSRVLGCTDVRKSYCEGKDYIVSWAMGHLVELADPEEYNENWKTWKMDYLPMLPEKMKLKVIGRTSQQFRTFKELFARKDVSRLIIATDAGREGELVARWIMRLGGWKGPVERLWISSQTDQAIREGFKTLKPGSQYENLFHAAECRSEADWIIGLNVTRALCCKYDAKLSAGRVQTPTLAMIVDREKEISSFKPEAYWTINADHGSFISLWHSKNNVTRIKDHDFAIEVSEKVKGKDAVVKNVIVTDKTELPPLAYDLTALQRDANSIIGFSAKKTLDTLQGLYERHKIVTYPRTDSRHITTDMEPTLKDRLRALENTKYGSIAKELIKKDLKPGKRFIDNSKVSDHHAVIPTEEKVILERLNNDERMLWDLIAKRFLAVLSPPFKYKAIVVTLDIGGETFKARGIQTVDRGWKAVGGGETSENENSDDDLPVQNLSAFREGDKIPVKKITVVQGFTKPPARYTEGTLLAAMESPGKFINDDELKASILKGGLGTPATRADIIEKLFANYYIERNGKELVPTSQGIELIEIVPKDLRSPELTAQWELRLSKIALGQEKSFSFTQDMRENAKTLVNLVKNAESEFKPRNESTVKCPMCGKKLLNVKDKKGKRLLVCRSRSCGYEQDADQRDDLSRKPSQKEKYMTRKLMNTYGADIKSEAFTLGDLLKISEEKKKNK